MCKSVSSGFEASLYELLGIGTEVVQHLNDSGYFDGPDELLKLFLVSCSENYWHIADNYKIQLEESIKAPE